MNCLEFHREKLADPRRLSQPALAHEGECASCAAFARSVDENERALERAFATPVPEGLAERVLLRARAGSPFASRRRALAAAGVVVAVPLGFALLRSRGPAQPPDQYARLAIEHVTMEPESLTTVRNADPEAFRTVIESFGGTLKAPVEGIRYVRLCPVEEGMGWHIVFDTSEGLATLILVPDKPLRSTQAAATKGWSALVRPAGNGYYAIVTASSAATARVDRLMSERIDWKT
jgi:hypothetical protein